MRSSSSNEKIPFRCYLEICYLITYEKVSVRKFKNKFSLTYFKYNNDYLKICKLATYYGIKIISTGDMIFYQIVDSIIFESIKNKCSDFYYKNKNRIYNDFYNDIIQIESIGRTLILNEDKVTIDNLADKIGLTRSGIRSYIKICRNIISSYGIKINNVPYKGLILEGTEFNYRLVCLSFYNSIASDVVVLSKDSILDQEKFKEQKQVLKKYLADEKLILINENYVDKLATYLLITKRRISQNKFISDLTSKKISKNDFFNFNIYKLAKRIIDYLIKDYSVGECKKTEEYIALEILLISFFSQINFHDYNLLNNFFSVGTSRLVKHYTHMLSSGWGIKISADNEQNFIYENCLKIEINDSFGFLPYKIFGVSGKNGIYYENPLIGYLCDDIRHETRNFYGKAVTTHWTDFFVYFLLSKIYSNSVKTTKINVDVFSVEGFAKAKVMTQLLYKKVNLKEINRIKIAISPDQISKDSILVSDISIDHPNKLIIGSLEEIEAKSHQIKLLMRNYIKLAAGNIIYKRSDFSDKNDLYKNLNLNKNTYPNISIKRFKKTMVALNRDNKVSQSKIVYGYLKKTSELKNGRFERYIFVNFSTDISLKYLSELIRIITEDNDIFDDFANLGKDVFDNKYLVYLKRQ